MVHNVIMMSDLLSQTSVLVSCSKSAQLFVNSGATMFKFPSPRNTWMAKHCATEISRQRGTRTAEVAVIWRCHGMLTTAGVCSGSGDKITT